MTAHKRSDPISLWLLALREHAGWEKAAVALANKNARILWAVMTKGEAFDPRHVSVKPGASPRPRSAQSIHHPSHAIHHAAGISQKTQATGQTGSRQARPTLGGSLGRCPRDLNGDPAERFASGSAHQATAPVQQGRL
jgi:hypothetical protein